MLRATESPYFAELITRGTLFAVPKYQRSYAWEEEEVTDFIRDLRELYDARKGNNNLPKKHFFGGIVSIERYISDSSDTGLTYDIVDGQQRLATLMMTIALLVKGLKLLAEEARRLNDLETADEAQAYADTIRDNFLVYTVVVGRHQQKKMRLKLSTADAAFFESLLRDDASQVLIPSRKSHERLLNAWKLIYQGLIQQLILSRNDLDCAKKLQEFLKLRFCIVQDCYFIHISSDNMAEAYRLFAVLNDRGKILSDGDLLRIYTLEMLEGHQTQQEHLERAWDEILGYSYDDIRSFLHAYYPSCKGTRAPTSDFVDKFREQFFNYTPPVSYSKATEIDRHVDQMRREIKVFHDITDGAWPYENPTASTWQQSRLSYLIKIQKHTLCIPLLMSAYQGLLEPEFANLVHLLDLFVFRYINMVGAHPTSLGNQYYKFAAAIRENASGFSLDKFKSELLKLQNAHAKDDFFEEALLQKLNYKQSVQFSRNSIRYFLTTIEYYLPWYNRGAAGKPMPDKSRTFELNSVDLEHIYPQKPKIEDLELEPFKQDIGNLTFWAPEDNVEARNELFESKKAYYSESNVRLTRELARCTQWNLEELEKRKKRLIDIAKKIFSA